MERLSPILRSQVYRAQGEPGTAIKVFQEKPTKGACLADAEVHSRSGARSKYG